MFFGNQSFLSHNLCGLNTIAPPTFQGRRLDLVGQAMLAGSLPCFAAEQAGDGTSTLGARKNRKNTETEEPKRRVHIEFIVS